MSNVKRSYNTSRRIRKGCKLERLIRFVLMRPLRTKTKVLADEHIIESPIRAVPIRPLGREEGAL